ncbi:hypothetical protein [Luteimonas sp. 100069]|uniref:hypothetical protein n=1 Tax=Luteimonas sp. 100069 TaxID=2006109 RepID=UPI000F50596E|nr:hypothetical protein [Luteimonas sp. 100069]
MSWHDIHLRPADLSHMLGPAGPDKDQQRYVRLGLGSREASAGQQAMLRVVLARNGILDTSIG